jgi:hypothetical protein
MKLGNWLAVVGGVGISVASVLGAPGCTATLSVGPCDGSCVGPIGDDGGFTSPDTGTPFSACNSCLYGQCVGAYSNCIQNADCLTAYQCATAPACVSSASCVEACVANASATGQRLYAALGDCDFYAECPGGSTSPQCAATCAPSPDYCALPDAGTTPPPDAGTPEDSGTTPDAATDDGGTVEDAAATPDAAPAQTCDQCQATNCAAQLTACANGTACAAYNQCVLACQSATCTQACQTANAAGFQAAGALGTCTQTSCATPCQ